MPFASHHITEARGAIVLELKRELDSRRDVFPDRINKGRMQQREADYQISVWQEISANVGEKLGSADWHVTGRKHSWRQKIEALDRELDYRRRLYPDRVDKGRMDNATAQHRIEIVQMVRDLYWRHMFGWDLPPGVERGSDAYHDAVWKHIELVDRGDETTQQELGI